jgi:hypothetical protein
VLSQYLANLPSSCPTDASSLESCISALKSSISILESSIKATDASSGWWETFAWACAIAVGFGVLGEIVSIAFEHLENLEGWRRGIVRPPDKPPAWRFWFDIVATLLVVGGVFGEAGASGEIASINSQLRSKTSELRAKSDLLLAVITEIAGDAANSATIAHDEATLAKVEAVGAIQKSREVEKRADDLLTRYISSEKEIDAERNKRLQMEIALAPRVLPQISGNAGNVFPLKKFAGIRTVIEYVPDAEAERAASELRDLVRAAKWGSTKSDMYANPQLFHSYFDGVVIETYDPYDPIGGGEKCPFLRRALPQRKHPLTQAKPW